MARRRGRGGIEEGIAAIVVALSLLVFMASGFNVRRFGAIVQGLFFLFIIVVLAVIVVVILFFTIRAAAKSGHASPPTSDAPVRIDPLSARLPLSSLTTEGVIQKLRATDWYQFEKVVGLIYQAQGYRSSRRGGANPDGGIDLLIEKDGVIAAVQCKHWKKWKVDVSKVRELIGSMTHEGLPRGVIVTLNGFTQEAEQLAQEHSIDIVHDEKLAAMIASLSPADQLKVQAMLDDTTKRCPKCEAKMVWRTPKPGKKWTPFWGCSRYPQCHGMLQDD